MGKGDSYYSNNGTNALIRVDATGKSSYKVANDVQSVVFSENSDEIFFVKHASSDETYDLKKYDIVSNQVEDYSSNSKSFEVKAVANGKVFISASHGVGSTTDIKVSNIAHHSDFALFYAYSDSATMSYANDGTVVAVNGNVISIVKSLTDIKVVIDAEATSINVIGFANGCVYYYDEVSNIKYVSYSNVLAGNQPEIKTLTTIDAVSQR